MSVRILDKNLHVARGKKVKRSIRSFLEIISFVLMTEVSLQAY